MIEKQHLLHMCVTNRKRKERERENDREREKHTDRERERAREIRRSQNPLLSPLTYVA